MLVSIEIDMTESTPTTSSSPSQSKSWIEMINESVHTSDDIDIGDIDAISRDFIVVKRGFVNIHHYYIPIIKVEGWDGNVLWLHPRIYKCGLCDRSFNTEDELSKHVTSQH